MSHRLATTRAQRRRKAASTTFWTLATIASVGACFYYLVTY